MLIALIPEFKMFSRSRIFTKLRLVEKLTRFKESTDAKSKSNYSEIFFDKQVQNLLRKLTNVDFEKVFQPRKQGRWEAPQYFLMTTEQLEKEKEKTQRKANYFLQIPPYVLPKEDKLEILDDNPELDGHDVDHAKFMFTDISFDVDNQKRTIVVREPDGVLRKAFRHERHRANQIFYPLAGRELEMPKMFEEENLKVVLDREDYKFILDRACAQFEPDDVMYHKVTQIVYERINDKKHFSMLHSTRHFGALTFYLVINKKIDNMLIDNIKSERAENAFDLVKLYHIVHPDCKSAVGSKGKEKDEDILNCYIQLEAKQKDELELSWQHYVSIMRERKELEDGLKTAHGI